MTARARSACLLAILALSAAMRLHNLSRPMADSLQAKQVYVANRARSIAQAPFNPLRSSLDFLDAGGRRMEFTEEVPAYTTLLALGYRIAGEHDWVGHVLSLIGTLAALCGFYSLVRREWDDRSALVATTILSFAPLFLFYGRAVMPESWMLAMMLIAAASYRRHLDEGGVRWLAIASLAAMAAGAFKYFGLMIFVPLAEMACRKHGSWRGVFSRSFIGMLLVATMPLAAWMGLVFFRGANPVQSGWVDGQVMPYLVFQAPSVLWDRAVYASFFGRFLVRDCGAFTLALMAIGIASVVRGRRAGGMLAGWTVMALLYYLLLAPKLLDHDYYELMMLPMAALWATRGLNALAGRRLRESWHPLSPAVAGGPGGVAPRAMGWSRAQGGGAAPAAPPATTVAPMPSSAASRHLLPEGEGNRPPRRVMIAVLAVLVVAQSPWVMGGLFRQDDGKIALADSLKTLCPPDARVVAIGPGIEFPTVIHYSSREGWPVHSRTLPDDWREVLAKYRAAGASFAAVYFEPKATAAQRASYAPLLREFPIAERRSDLHTRSGPGAEYVILDLTSGSRRAPGASVEVGRTAGDSAVR